MEEWEYGEVGEVEERVEVVKSGKLGGGWCMSCIWQQCPSSIRFPNSRFIPPSLFCRSSMSFMRKWNGCV